MNFTNLQPDIENENLHQITKSESFDVESNKRDLQNEASVYPVFLFPLPYLSCKPLEPGECI